MVHQLMKPLTVVKLTNQLNAVSAPLETVMKVKREKSDYPHTRSVDGQLCLNRNKTHAESDGSQWKTTLRNSAEDLGGLATNGKAVQDAGGSVQGAGASREGAS